jgi:hypothetical protein
MLTIDRITRLAVKIDWLFYVSIDELETSATSRILSQSIVATQTFSSSEYDTTASASNSSL